MSIFPRIIFDANVLTYLYKLGLLDVCLDAVKHPYTFDLIRDVELKDMPWAPVVREKIDVLSLDPKQMADADSYRSTEGWTIDTLISSHKSMPYNPSIAGVFYRAGYIENWGRGITKIYESCENLGAPKPEYEIIGYGISVRFPALQSAIITAPKLKNFHGKKYHKDIFCLCTEPM